MSLLDQLDKERIPRHIAIIMDGNGRWAQARNLNRSEGHKAGVETLRGVLEAAAKASVSYLTLYAFSTENWNRPEEEVDGLMDLMVHAVTNETKNLQKNGVKMVCIGDRERLPERTRKALEQCIRDTAGGRRITVVMALSYSSKWEIVTATQRIVADVIRGALPKETIDEATFDRYLSTAGIPDPDLLIRTGGEQRISNFLLWQCAYAEFYFTDMFWPDFNDEALYKAILDYQGRERRYGKTSEQIETGQ